MKKLIYCALALAAGLFAASCQQENLEPVAQGNTVTYTVEVPGVVTKAVADGKNVDRLYYEVYMTNGTTKADLSDATLLYKKDIAMVTSQEATSRANVTLNLVQNQNYTVLFWAQCDIENPIYDVTDLRKVTYKEGATIKSNHEDYAAFYAVDYISDATPRDKKVYLKRPFAQLNIGTTINPIDYNEDPYRVVMRKSKVTVKDVPTTFNVATSTVGGDAEFTFEMEEVISDENLVVNNTEYNYAAMNYMFAGDNRTATVEYWLEAEVMTQNNVTVPTNLNKAVVNVPLKENYRTNIVGNLLTSSTEYEVIVDADWAGADLAPDPLYLAAANGGDVTLTKDIVLTAPLEVKAKMTINLNGKTISNPNNYAIENYSELTISGEGNMVGLGGIRSHNGKVIINGGTYTASSDWNTGTYQHILKAVNTEVIINGGIFDATIEGITNAMINVSENSTVTINGGEFRNVMKGEVIPQFAPYMFTYEKNGKLIINDGSFYGGWRFNGETATTDIYGGDFTVSYDGQSFHANSTHVLTVYGGVFSLENGGKLNPTNHLAAGYKVIEKDGKFYVVSEETNNVVATRDELKNALNEAKADGKTDVIIDAAGASLNLEYGFSSSNVPTGTTVTIRNANVEGKSKNNYADGTLIFEDCTFNNPGGAYSIHFDGGKGSLIFKNCDLYGWNSFGGELESVSFENCTLSGNGIYALIRSYTDLTLKNCTINTSNANHTDQYPEGVEVINGATLTEENVVYVVYSDEDLAKVIPVPTPNNKKTILLAEGTYSDNINLTVEQFGEIEEDIVFKAAEGTSPVIAGTVTLGYRNQGVGAAMWNGNVTFEGITFDHAEAAKHSISVGDVKSLTLKKCTIIGDGEYGIDSARGNATGTSKIEGCTFVNSAMQLLGNLATGLVIDNCTFNESRINVQAGNGVTVQNCTFNSTLKSVHVGDSFYCVRSNSTPITVKNCEINIDSELAEVATSQAKWYLLANRGTTDWTVENVAVTMTDAALQQTELQVIACTSTGNINTNNLTVNGFPYGISKNSEGVYVADPSVAGTLNWLKSNEPEIFLNGKVQYGSVLYTYANDGANVIMAAATEEAKTARYLVNDSTKDVIVSEGVAVIGDRTFRDAPNMETISLPNSLITIENDAFQKAYALKEITIPENVRSIGTTCFGACSSLEKITINAVHITFHNYCARACANLKEVFIYSDKIEFGAGSMYFTNKENADASAITFYVKNQEIADEFYAGMSTSHSYGLKIVSLDGQTTYYNTLK